MNEIEIVIVFMTLPFVAMISALLIKPFEKWWTNKHSK